MPEFGDSVLVIKDADEFIRRVAAALQKEGLIHARGNVRYFDGNDLEYFQDVKDEPVHFNTARVAAIPLPSDDRSFVDTQTLCQFVLGQRMLLS